MTTRIAPRHPTFVLLGLLGAGLSPAAAQDLVIRPDPESMLVKVTAFGDQEFFVLVPKSLGTAEDTLMNFPATPIHWNEGDDGKDWVGHYREEGVLEFRAGLETATIDDDTHLAVLRMEATNLGSQSLEDVWLFTFMAPHGAPLFHDSDGERTFLSTNEGVTSLAAVDWPESQHPNMAVFPVEGRDGWLPRQLLDLQVESLTRPNAGWMFVMNEEEDAFAGMASPNPLFLFRNREISSLHVAPLLGDVAPAQTGRAEIHLLFGQGDQERAVVVLNDAARELHERYCPLARGLGHD